MNEQEILNKLKMNIAISNFKNEYNNKHTLIEKIKLGEYMIRKKVIVTTCGLVFVISSGVFAYNKIASSFGFGKGIDSAAENGYIANPEMDYVSSNTTVTNQKTNITLDDINVDAKIEDFIMDDITIGTHFTFEIDTKINETIDLNDLQDIELKDLIVTDEDNKILFCMDKGAFEKYCQENNLNYQFGEFNENYYNCGLNAFMTYHFKEGGTIKFTYNMYSDGNSFPKCKKLNFSFGKIQLMSEDSEVILKGNWTMNFDVPKEIYNRKSIAYKVVSCENPDFKVTNATLSNTGFELGIVISNMERPQEPQILRENFQKVINGEMSIDEYNERVNTEKEWIEASNQYHKALLPITVYDWIHDSDPEYVTYIENEKGEKFTISSSAGRRQDANYKDGNIFNFYETFTLTTYDATNKLKVRVLFRDTPYIIELERVK